MSQILPANRIAAIAGFLTGLGAFITSIEGALPSKWQNFALGAVGLIGSAVTVLHFMSGSQKFDALTAKTVQSSCTLVSVPGASSPAVEQTLAEIQAVADAQAAFQAQPGAGAVDPPHGLAPDVAPITATTASTMPITTVSVPLTPPPAA